MWYLLIAELKKSRSVCSVTQKGGKKYQAAHTKRKSCDVQWVMKYWKTFTTCVSWDKGTWEGEGVVSSEADFHDLPWKSRTEESLFKKNSHKVNKGCEKIINTFRINFFYLALTYKVDIICGNVIVFEFYRSYFDMAWVWVRGWCLIEVVPNKFMYFGFRVCYKETQVSFLKYNQLCIWYVTR